LFEVRDPEEVIRAAAESALREAVAGRPFIELLTVERGKLQRDVVGRLERRCHAYGPNGLGIAIDGLALPDVHPPQDVVQAYHEVARAMENRDRMVNEALAAAIRQERESQAEAIKTVRVAEADKHRQLLLAQADKAVFLARLRARTELNAEQEWLLARDAVLALFRGQPTEIVYQDYQRRRRQLLTAQAALTDFRLFWDALGLALAGREKVILDADRVPGRRQLLLFDPDKFRVPVPILVPDRGPPERRGIRGEDEGP
jgi:regulator of protease activity HflC (stomatin/prohibitin superfamily)